MAAQLQQMRCTIHNLEFGFDSDRVRALGAEPALMRCPMCMRAALDSTVQELDEARGHRDLLLQAIDLKRTLVPAL
jgi:hypothetical protein